MLESVLYLLRVPSLNCMTTSPQLFEPREYVAPKLKKMKNYLWASSLTFCGLLSAGSTHSFLQSPDKLIIS